MNDYWQKQRMKPSVGNIHGHCVRIKSGPPNKLFNRNLSHLAEISDNPRVWQTGRDIYRQRELASNIVKCALKYLRRLQCEIKQVSLDAILWIVMPPPNVQRTDGRKLMAKLILLRQKCIWPCSDLDLWSLTLQTFSAMSGHMLNICAKLYRNPSTKYGYIALREVGVNGHRTADRTNDPKTLPVSYCWRKHRKQNKSTVKITIGYKMAIPLGRICSIGKLGYQPDIYRKSAWAFFLYYVPDEAD